MIYYSYEEHQGKQNVSINNYRRSYIDSGIYALFNLVKTMAIPKFKPLAEASTGTKKVVKPLLIGLIAILAAAFGLESTNNDFDLGKLLKGESLQESKVARDDSGNVLFDKLGNVTTDKTIGKKSDEYNCEDFTTQPEAQSFFLKVGGTKNDVNRLDGDNNGVACQDLPKGE